MILIAEFICFGFNANPAISLSKDTMFSDSVKPQFTKILDFSIADTIWNRTHSIDDMVLFNGEIFCVNRESVYILDSRNRRLNPCINGMDIKRDEEDAATRLAILNNNLYVALLDNGIYLFDTIGQIWKRMHQGMPDNDTTFFDLISCNGTLYAPAHDDGLFALNERNQKWEKVKGEKARGILKCSCLDSVLWLGTIANDLFVLSPKSGELRKVKSFKEPEWVEKSMIGAGITAMMNRGDTLYMGVHVSGIFKSLDRGKTWDQKRIKFVVGVAYDWEGYMLVSDNFGYRNGLFILDPQTDEMLKVDLGLGDVKVEYMECLDGTFYLCTNESLFSIPCEDFKKYYLQPVF